MWVLSICLGLVFLILTSNPKQVAFAVQEYIQNYCMKEVTDENT